MSPMAFFVSALADEILKRLWNLTIAFLICSKTSGIQLGGGVVRLDPIEICLDKPMNYCYLQI